MIEFNNEAIEKLQKSFRAIAKDSYEEGFATGISTVIAILYNKASSKEDKLKCIEALYETHKEEVKDFIEVLSS